MVPRAAWLAFGLVLSATTPARADDAATDPGSDDPQDRAPQCQTCDHTGFRFQFELPIWIPSVSGNLAFGSVDGDEPPPDNVSLNTGLRFAFVGGIGLAYDRLVLEASIYGVSVASDLEVFDLDGGEALLSVGAGVALTVLGYRLGPWKTGDVGQVVLAPYAGARMIYVDIGATPFDRQYEFERFFADPVVGFTAIWDTREHVAIEADLDVSGFGLGTRIGTWFSPRVRWRPIDWFSIWAGWNLLHWRVTREGFVSVKRIRLNLNGPTLALAFHAG